MTDRHTHEPSPNHSTTETPLLVFHTGFEGDARVVPSTGSDDRLVGADTTLPGPTDPDKELAERWGVKELQIQYTGGHPSQRTGRIVPDPAPSPDNPGNRVLHFQIKEGYLASENQVKCRVQANLYGFTRGFDDFYQSVRVFVPEHMGELSHFPGRIPWLTIAEFWNNAWWGVHTYGFRITLGIGKPAGHHPLTFLLDAEDDGQILVWGKHDHDVEVPLGRWFTMDLYFKDGDASTGRFWMAITPDGGERRVVFDVTHFTHNSSDPVSDGITHWNPLKLYTSAELAAFMKSRGKTLDIYFDDFRLWTHKRP